MDRCDRHPFEVAEDVCDRCGLTFCSDCLVYSFGPKKPPFCIPCAVAAAGVRTTAGSRPQVSGRAMRQAQAEMRKASKFLGGRRRRDVPVEPNVPSQPEPLSDTFGNATSLTDYHAS